MHIDPVEHAAQHYAAADSYQDEMERAEDKLRSAFIIAVNTKPLESKAGFGNTFSWDGIASVQVDATVLDVLVDAMDYRNNSAVVFKALVLCANKGDIDAAAALQRLANTYAEIHAEVAE
jgi:hypothetical protein